MNAADLAARIETCQACHGNVMWASTFDGKPVVVTADPHRAGDVALHLAGDALIAAVPPKAKAAAMRGAGVALYREHRVDCHGPDLRCNRTRR